jgi:hypothetical protein
VVGIEVLATKSIPSPSMLRSTVDIPHTGVSVDGTTALERVVGILFV